MILAKNTYKNKEKLNKLFQLCFILSNHYNCLFLCEDWKIPILLHFMEVLYQKDWKVAKIREKKHAFCIMVAIATTMT